MANSGGGIVDPYPSASRVVGATEKSIGESGVSPIDSSNGESVLFAHNFIGALLPVAREVALGELIAIEALMDTTVRSLKDGEGEAWEASDVDFIRGEARSGADGVVIGVFDVGKVDVPVVLSSLQTMANIWAIVGLTRSTPPLPLGREALVVSLRIPSSLYTAVASRAQN